MEAELAALASSGATALAGLMVSDAWTQFKDGFARLLSRLAAAEEPLEELERSRVELVTAHLEHDEAKVAAVESRWRARLERLLRTDATAADELRRLLAAAPRPPGTSIFNSNSGNAEYGSIIQAGYISGATFHTAPPFDQRTSDHDQ